MLNNTAKNVSQNTNKSKNYKDYLNFANSISGISDTFQNGSAMQRIQSAADIVKTIMALMA